MSETKKSVMNCVKEFATANRTFTINDVCKAYPDKSKTQLATALWKMRVAGMIAKGPDGVFAVLTDVNKPVPNPKKVKKVKTVKKAKPVVKPVVNPTHSELVKGGMAKTISKLNTELAECKKTLNRADMVYEELALRHRALQSTHDSLKEMHTDALAVIRYLENKLYVALQQVVKNGRNS